MDVAYPQNGSEGTEQGGLELTPAVSGDDSRAAETGHPTANKCCGDCFRCDVRDRDRLWPAREAVHTRHQVAGPSRWWQGADQVNVHVRETGVRWMEWRGRSNCMPCYFDALALEAGACPLADISIHGGPEPPGCDEVLSCSDAGVTLAVEGVEHGSTKRRWNVRSWDTG